MLDEVPLATRRQIAQEIAEALRVGQRTIPPRQHPRVPSSRASARRREPCVDADAALPVPHPARRRARDVPARCSSSTRTRSSRASGPTCRRCRTCCRSRRELHPRGRHAHRHDRATSTSRRRPARYALGAELRARGLRAALQGRAASRRTSCARCSIDWVQARRSSRCSAICCATFLSFPVACLLSFTIFIAGTIGPFLAGSLRRVLPAADEPDGLDQRRHGHPVGVQVGRSRASAQVLVFLLEASASTGRRRRWSRAG